MLSQQQYTKELAEAERYHNSAARQQSNDVNNVGGSSPNNKQQYTDEENAAYNTIINNIKDPQELYAILHEMKQKRLHRTNNNNNKPRRHRHQRQQRRSKSKRRVSRGSSSSDDTPTLDTPSSTTESSTTLIDTLSNFLFPFHSIFQDTDNNNNTLDEQEEDTPASSPFDTIMSYLGYDNSNTNDAGHYECGSSDSTTNGESSCSSSFDSSTNLVDSFNIFNIWNNKKSNSSSREKYRRSSSGSSAISPRNVEDSWVTKDELNEW